MEIFTVLSKSLIARIDTYGVYIFVIFFNSFKFFMSIISTIFSLFNLHQLKTSTLNRANPTARSDIL